MVKLAAVRSNRMYGPRGSEAICEVLNATAYLVATVLLLCGFILLLPGFYLHNYPNAALIILSIALCIIILVNVHDIFAQAAGIDFRLRIAAYDPQLAFVELGAPVAHIIGGMLLLISVISIAKSNGLDVGGREHLIVRLLVAGSVFWLLGSLQNAFQVYERVNAAVQIYQKAVSLPLIMGSTLFLVSSIVWMSIWPNIVASQRTRYVAATVAISASVLFVIAALANMNRVLYLKRISQAFNVVAPSPAQSPLASSFRGLDKLRGGAAEELERERRAMLQPLLISAQEEQTQPQTTYEAPSQDLQDVAIPVPAPALIPLPVPVPVPAPAPEVPTMAMAVPMTPVQDHVPPSAPASPIPAPPSQPPSPPPPSSSPPASPSSSTTTPEPVISAPPSPPTPPPPPTPAEPIPTPVTPMVREEGGTFRVISA